jgi:hypothetical protein
MASLYRWQSRTGNVGATKQPAPGWDRLASRSAWPAPPGQASAHRAGKVGAGFCFVGLGLGLLVPIRFRGLVKQEPLPGLLAVLLLELQPRTMLLPIAAAKHENVLFAKDHAPERDAPSALDFILAPAMPQITAVFTT